MLIPITRKYQVMTASARLAMVCKRSFTSVKSYPRLLSNSSSSFYSSSGLYFRRPPNASVRFLSEAVKEASKEQQPSGLMARLKLLMRRYGWSVIGVYMAISTFDLGASFVLVKVGGAERIAEIEHRMMDVLGGWIVMKKAEIQNRDPQQVLEEEKQKQDRLKTLNSSKDSQSTSEQKQEPSLWTIFAIAYGIHKVLMPVRIGLTAALTPPTVKLLQRMGWNVGRQVMDRQAKKSVGQVAASKIADTARKA